MNDEITAAIKALLKEIKGRIEADKSLKYTQSVLNLAHAAATLAAANNLDKK